MLALVFTFLVLFAALAILFFAGTLWLQGNIYSEPTTGLSWKASAAAAVLTAFYALWAVLDYKTLDVNDNDLPFDTIFRFSPVETRQVDKFVAKVGDKEIPYKLERSGSFGAPQYVEEKNPKRPFSRSGPEGAVEEIIVKDDKGEMHFRPQLTKEGKVPTGEQFPDFYQVNGRYRMNPPGHLSVFRWGLLIGNLALNAFHLAVWFVCLWLVLRFQWTHALFMAAIFWGAMTVVVVPMLLKETQQVRQKRAGLPTALRYEPVTTSVRSFPS